MFYVAYRTLLVMFCVLKFYLVDFYGMFTSPPTWRLKMHVLCKVGKNIIFQNKTLLVMFYRHNKTCWYQFCNFKHYKGIITLQENDTSYEGMKKHKKADYNGVAALRVGGKLINDAKEKATALNSLFQSVFTHDTQH